jgi:hypothetical protein
MFTKIILTVIIGKVRVAILSRSGIICGISYHVFRSMSKNQTVWGGVCLN